MNKLHLTFFFNIVSLTFLTWISHRGNEVGELNKYLNIKNNKDSTWKVRNDRLLTNDDPKNEMGQSRTSYKTTLTGEQNKLKYITGSSEIHEKLKRNTSNSMHTYIKKLEHEYPNKKGLKRLDCHYEKKLFAEMYKLDKITGNMKSKNGYFKKIIWKRYGLRFIVFLIVILFGIAMSLLCKFGGNSGDNVNVHKNIDKYILGINGAFYIPLIIAFLSFIIYILSIVKKYKSLKRKYDKISLI